MHTYINKIHISKFHNDLSSSKDLLPPPRRRALLGGLLSVSQRLRRRQLRGLLRPQFHGKRHRSQLSGGQHGSDDTIGMDLPWMCLELPGGVRLTFSDMRMK